MSGAMAGIWNFTPTADELELLCGFRRGCEIILRPGSEEGMHTFNRLLGSVPMPDEITTDDSARPPHPAPAMDIHTASFLKGLVDCVEDGGHYFVRGDVVVVNCKAMIGRIDFVGASLFLQNGFI